MNIHKILCQLPFVGVIAFLLADRTDGANDRIIDIILWSLRLSVIDAVYCGSFGVGVRG